MTVWPGRAASIRGATRAYGRATQSRRGTPRPPLVASAIATAMAAAATARAATRRRWGDREAAGRGTRPIVGVAARGSALEGADVAAARARLAHVVERDGV